MDAWNLTKSKKNDFLNSIYLWCGRNYESRRTDKSGYACKIRHSKFEINLFLMRRKFVKDVMVGGIHGDNVDKKYGKRCWPE